MQHATDSVRHAILPFRGICLGVPKQDELDVFRRLIMEVLPEHGCNVLVLMVRYRFRFKTHPAVCDNGALESEQAAELAALCRANGIRLIPKMNLFGHQSGKKTGSEQGMLRAYPEFDETPDLSEVRYCRSLCPTQPKVKQVVFELADELIEAFQADAIHVGLDEVFEIGHCPRCKGTANDILFADWVSALHAHFVGERNIEMLMWGDRLLNAEATGYGEWEAAKNNTWPALDRIPNDIILCDWHYKKRDDYPSVTLFAEHGFRHVVCPWHSTDATEAFLQYAEANRTEKLLGVLQTSWCRPRAVAEYLLQPSTDADEKVRGVGESFKYAMKFAGA